MCSSSTGVQLRGFRLDEHLSMYTICFGHKRVPSVEGLNSVHLMVLFAYHKVFAIF